MTQSAAKKRKTSMISTRGFLITRTGGFGSSPAPSAGPTVAGDSIKTRGQFPGEFESDNGNNQAHDDATEDLHVRGGEVLRRRKEEPNGRGKTKEPPIRPGHEVAIDQPVKQTEAKDWKEHSNGSEVDVALSHVTNS